MTYHYIKENEKELIIIDFEEIDKLIAERERELKLPLNVLRDMMGKALTGSLDEKFYLSSIAPGYGKSKLVQEAVSGWVADGSLKEGGALIALSKQDGRAVWFVGCYGKALLRVTMRGGTGE